jgi:hypothetical protein
LHETTFRNDKAILDISADELWVQIQGIVGAPVNHQEQIRHNRYTYNHWSELVAASRRASLAIRALPVYWGIGPRHLVITNMCIYHQMLLDTKDKNTYCLEVVISIVFDIFRNSPLLGVRLTPGTISNVFHLLPATQGTSIYMYIGSP